nr:PfaB family protein [Shewanella intestini]
MRSLPNQQVDTKTNTCPATPKYWFTQVHQSRVASFNFIENNLQHAAVFVQGTELAQASSMLDENRLFFPIAAKTLADMVQALMQLSLELKALHPHQDPSPCDSANPLKSSKTLALMLKTISEFDQTRALSAVIMASSLATAIVEIQAMLAKIHATTDSASTTTTEIDYKTPAGSCLSVNQHQALGLNGVCFVYPGVGTVYPHMLAQLPRYFPALFAQLEREGDLKAMLQADSIYAEHTKISDMSLDKLAIAGAGASYILTKVLSEYFGIKPQFAMGYSMGEAAMWASLNVWKNPYNLIKTTQHDPIFISDITGELNCVRQAWQLTHGEDIVWNSFVVRAAPSEINALLDDYPRVYLAIKQGDTCVIAGCEQSCKALLSHMGKRGIAANRVTAMHTKPAMLIHDKVHAFYQQPLREQALLDTLPSQIKFISAASKSPVLLNSDAIAKSIADTFCQPLDFTALVNHARTLGASLFVEIGADRQTSTLIDKIARNAKPSNAHVKSNPTFTAIAANAKGDDQTALLKCIAQLISHKVPLSLNYVTDSLSHLLAATHALETRQQNVAAQLTPQLQGEQS